MDVNVDTYRNARNQRDLGRVLATWTGTPAGWEGRRADARARRRESAARAIDSGFDIETMVTTLEVDLRKVSSTSIRALLQKTVRQLREIRNRQ